MPSDFQRLLKDVAACSIEQKAQIFRAIRDAVSIHEIERLFNVRAEVILEAIHRATDLTQRGVRGIIAETIFAVDIASAAEDWQSEPVIGDVPYDVCLTRPGKRVRIQVKMQRKEKGVPKRTKDGQYVVEVQRTRTGVNKEVAKRGHTDSENLTS